ncbi:RNase adapter RapZ [Pseudothauera nasutitermitis]|uniref:RNase adapter RapZ n=1 Tax=Pseudothauera nasutitermitis TaxID=2565930 RepID=A0A4S4ATJ6_9RHOO|nr:RNase adapter RapZ [Pseudothauera nasutitermitis]THF63192.1 RNase adapter RapZ [Pseudothauera nasutitermitis]
MQIILISGLSGSGKSVALDVLEDAGYYVVDNLPATLLPQLIDNLREAGRERVAVAVDVRSGASIAALPEQVAKLRGMVDDLRFIFLEARDDALIARFSETRRRHPLASEEVSLEEAIRRERDLLAEIAELGHRVDTSDLRANTLRSWVKDFVRIEATEGLTLMFQSFGFKYGIPLDADLVFDVRCLPNPHYDPQLRPLTGRDQPVIDFLAALPEVGRMAEDIRRFVDDWLPCYVRDNRSYLTVAIGCTGGKHRSVYLAEWLAARFRDRLRVQVRHRTAAARGEGGEGEAPGQL